MRVRREQGSGAGNGAVKATGCGRKGDTATRLHDTCLSDSEAGFVAILQLPDLGLRRQW